MCASGTSLTRAGELLLEGGPEKYEFLRKTRQEIDGVDDLEEWRELKACLTHQPVN